MQSRLFSSISVFLIKVVNIMYFYMYIWQYDILLMLYLVSVNLLLKWKLFCPHFVIFIKIKWNLLCFVSFWPTCTCLCKEDQSWTNLWICAFWGFYKTRLWCKAARTCCCVICKFSDHWENDFVNTEMCNYEVGVAGHRGPSPLLDACDRAAVLGFIWRDAPWCDHTSVLPQTQWIARMNGHYCGKGN